MGNLCNKKKTASRNTILRELFDLYDKNGDFNLKSAEFAVLSDFLKTKQLTKLNIKIKELTAESDRITGISPNEYVDELTGGIEVITSENFNKLLSSATIEELDLLLQRAKITMFNDLKEELDM
jgi:hypothetical protein